MTLALFENHENARFELFEFIYLNKITVSGCTEVTVFSLCKRISAVSIIYVNQTRAAAGSTNLLR